MTTASLAGSGALAVLVGPYSVPFFEVTGHFYAVADPSVSGTINDPQIQPVNALATFTPRLPVGFQAFVYDYLVTAAYNAKQTVSMIGNPVQGTWQVNFNGELTTSMPFSVSPAALRSALEALPSIGVGNVLVVAGINPQSYDVEFTGTLGVTSIPALVPTWNNLIDANGYDCTITVAVTATGSPQITAPTSISVPPRQARIMAGVLSTIDYVDTPGVQLVANGPIFELPGELIYDVSFTKVTFNGANQVLGNFAFEAPRDNTAVCLTDPALEKLTYQKPITNVWNPQSMVGVVVPIGAGRATWRQRRVG